MGKLEEIRARWAKFDEPDGRLFDVKAEDDHEMRYVAERVHGGAVEALRAAPADMAWLLGEVERLTKEREKVRAQTKVAIDCVCAAPYKHPGPGWYRGLRASLEALWSTLGEGGAP